ncbi:sepiapterin reductase [Holotrichia oblita]|uniref:Sepiapterin reductase n=1 Tax=Holotrichia oblita TaxID=644536 RepID=A0ACB9SS74_HOLOL|nr:sepiapterin reductase [Holotrichia oblita]
MVTAIDFNKKSLIIITGASQGIGREIGCFVGKICKSGSKIILIARSEGGLNESRNKIIDSNNDVVVTTYVRDLSKPDIEDYKILIDEILNDGKSYDNAIIFHNAGQVGALVNAVKLNQLETWRSYYDLNLFSVALLNSTFLERCKENIPNLYVINISSLCGHKPFADMALYGSGKAARDLYFSVLAIEEPNINVLKYCPGPVDTAMFNEVIEKAQNIELKTQFTEMKNNETVLTTKQTIGKLFEILESGKYKSGDLIDYFDRV